MPYTQLPGQISYPDVSTSAWVVISRLAEVPVRTVPRLDLLNHASEFALPFPSGRFPQKTITRTEYYQQFDSLGRALYDNGSGGTTSPVDGSGNPWPPLMVSVSEEVVVNLQDNPDQFTLPEIFHAVEADFLVKFPFYDWARLVVFDDRYDSISIYQNQQTTSGFGSGSHPIFLGPIQGFFDAGANPSGHILLVAPPLQGVDWVFQIRQGVAGPSGFKGPLADIAMASRQTNSGNTQEVTKIFPMENLALLPKMLTDASSALVTHFWVRTYANNQDVLPVPAPIIPFILILGRSSGLTT